MHKKILHWNNEHDQQQIVAALQNNKVIAGTSDTVIGLLANTTQQGFESLNITKGRSEKPYIVLVGNKAALNYFVQQPLALPIQSLIDHCWPGPLTLILKAHESLPSYLKSPNGAIALRMPNHAGLLDILQHFQGLFSTSANKAGMSIANTIEDLDPDIAASSDLIVSDLAECIPTKPSTIIDASTPNLCVIREGAYSIEELKNICDVIE